MRLARAAQFVLGLGAISLPCPVWAEAPAAAVRSERPLIGPPASWVLPAAIPPAPPAAEGAATIILLSDSQHRLTDEGNTDYFNGIQKIASAQGLDGGALQIEWDPALETVTIHHYRLIRNGVTIDLLGDGSKLTIVRRETNLERAALDGQLTATLQPEDVRVGDILDMAYSVTRRDPAMAGHSDLLVGPGDGLSYGRSRVRLLWPSSKPMKWRVLPGALQPKLGRANGDLELVSDLTNVTTARAPRGAPSRFQIINAIEATDFKDWATVSRVMAPLYAKALALAQDSAVKAEAARIAKTTSDPRTRAELALQLVQDNVRYLFLGMDDGGYVPAAAELTWTRRFGDCKAKTVLLIALLRELGIEARPVLVNTERGDFVAERLPAVSAFDHVIVEARIAGRSYWMDGTRLGDRHLDQLQTPNYRVGLPIEAEGAGLVPLIPEQPTQAMQVSSLMLDATKGIDAPAPASGEIRYRGDKAVDLRVGLAELSVSDRDKALRKMWRSIYDFVTPETVTTKVDPDSGDFIMTMTGTARMDWRTQNGARWYEVNGATLGWKLDTDRDGEINADAPFAFDYPDWWQNRQTIKLPRGGVGFGLQGGSFDRTIGGLYAFHRKVAISNGVMTMEAETRALAPELPAAKAEQTRRELTELTQDGVFIRAPLEDRAMVPPPIITPSAPPIITPVAPPPIFVPPPPERPEPAGDTLEQAKAHFREALDLFKKHEDKNAEREARLGVELAPDFGVGRALYALILATAGMPGADAEADRAIALDSGQWMAWRAKAMVAMSQQRYSDAIDIFNRTLARAKGDALTYSGRAIAYLEIGQYGRALADFDTARALDPSVNIGMDRAETLMHLGRAEDALDEADRTVASRPEDEAIRARRARLRAKVGRRQEAVADLNMVIARKPTAANFTARAAARPAIDRYGRQADLTAALRLDPLYVAAYRLRTSDEIDNGELDAAEADIAVWERLAPKDRDLIFMKQNILARRGKPLEALRMADEYVAKSQRSAAALYERCWMKATLNIAPETAAADCDAALHLLPASTAALESRGLAKLRIGRADEAIADYSEILKRDPYRAFSMYGRGIAWARKGDVKQARADLIAAQLLDPDIAAEFARYGLSPGFTVSIPE
ncbi:DUF3857 domain-containing protein [Flavisphingomonas formosensis]|uniref:DUF3857 domain-containing protein n=1 Tax=Flavisphingomonas formosensis TaxID=861534 RepID=UPI0018E0227A|nr:DUF3857 domain-containing protein [Sphingomonas formosensis]